MRIEDLTFDMVDGYAKACVDLHTYIGVLRFEGYDLLVVPSRGAHPFVDAAMSYGHSLPDLNRSGFFTEASISWPIEQLYLPFTADVGDDVGITSIEIRRYWTRVLAAIIRRDESDVARRFYSFLRKKTSKAGRSDLNIKGGKSGKFIFVDTVQSGRAICELFSTFENAGLDHCHFILLVDQRGAGLKAQHAHIIEAMVAKGVATRIDVAQLFTEDEGPSMSGIWTVTYPELMSKASQMIPQLAELGATGAGFYYVEVSRRADRSNEDFTKSNALLSVMMYTAVRQNDAMTKRFLENFRRHIQSAGLQDRAATRRVALPIVQRETAIASLDVSGSHVLRAYVGSDRAEATIREFLRE